MFLNFFSFVEDHKRTIAATIFFSMSVSLLFYVVNYGVNVVYGDEWDALIFVDGFIRNGFSFSELFRQHNEHVVVVPRLIMLLDAIIFGFNTKICMLITWMMTVIMAYVIYKYIFDRCSRSLFVVTLVPCVLYSVVQCENMLWGFQVCYMSSAFFAVLAFFILQVNGENGAKPGLFVLALALATLASLSVSQGLLVWPAGSLLILLQQRLRFSRFFFIWGLVGLLIWVVYFVSLHQGQQQTDILFVFKHPFAGIVFMVNIIASYFGGLPDGSSVLGVVAIVFFLAAGVCGFRSGACFQAPVVYGYAAFSALCLIAIAVGRAGSGAEMAFESRYTSIAAMVVVATLCMLLVNMRAVGSLPNKFATGVFIVFLLGALPLSYARGIERTRDFNSFQLENLKLLQYNERISEDDLRRLYWPDGSVVKQRAKILHRLGHEAFR